jgi:hypothetical protein
MAATAMDVAPLVVTEPGQQSSGSNAPRENTNGQVGTICH